MKEITKDMLVSDILAEEPGTAYFFFELGMPCLGCPSASEESVEKACAVHDIDPEILIGRVNEYLGSR